MFTLRTCSEKGQINILLGKEYNYLDKLHDKEAFELVLNNQYLKDEITSWIDTVTGLVVTSDCVYRMRKGEQNYIMTESGKTFAKL